MNKAEKHRKMNKRFAVLLDLCLELKLRTAHDKLRNIRTFMMHMLDRKKEEK